VGKGKGVNGRAFATEERPRGGIGDLLEHKEEEERRIERGDAEDNLFFSGVSKWLIRGIQLQL
jgi:hypothetical protein